MRWIKCFFMVGLMLQVSAINALLYRCDKADGSIEFRDRPCQTSLEQESVVPIRYCLTNPEQIQKETQKMITAQKKQLAKDAVQERKQARQQKSAEKKRAKEVLKEARRKIRCQKLNEKLNKIEAELRKGAKAKRFKRLQEEKAHCQQMKNRYCSVSTAK